LGFGADVRSGGAKRCQASDGLLARPTDGRQFRFGLLDLGSKLVLSRQSDGIVASAAAFGKASVSSTYRRGGCTVGAVRTTGRSSSG
jgi:hypothetical protein